MFFSKSETGNIQKHLSPTQLNVLMVGEKAAIDIEELISYANTNNIRLAGGIFPGVLYQNKSSDEGVILRTQEASYTMVRDIDNTDLVQVPPLPSEAKCATIFIDGLTSGIASFLEKLYDTYYDKIRFIGGGCGSLSLEQAPCVFSNDGFLENAALLIFDSRSLSLGVNHGWKKLAGPFVVSASNGNVVQELNWRPAFEVYQEVVKEHSGKEINSENFFETAKGYPFGIYREGTEDVVRDPIITDEVSLTCVGEITPSAVVNILSGDNQLLVEGAKKASEEAITKPCDDVLVVDCISRVLYEGDNFKDELDSIQEIIHQHNPTFSLEGVLSLGEISSYGEGYLEFFNKTIVVGAFLK